MVGGRFVSYAQNGEDVVLWRTLGHIRNGTYVEIGANDPVVDSVSWAFSLAGWSGLLVEPVREHAELLRGLRPRDTIVEAAATAPGLDAVTIHVIPQTGLSTTVGAVAERHKATGWSAEERQVRSFTVDQILTDQGYVDKDIHFLMVDVEGAEAAVLTGLDLHRFRPWVLVVEATAPRTTQQTHREWEPMILSAGYSYCLFDGISRFYLADEHRDLASALSYPACSHDDYVTAAFDAATNRRAAAEADLVRWRSAALARWSALAEADPEQATRTGEVDELSRELAAMRASTSWRLTAPLRRLKAAARRGPGPV
jgi:FkbM family methyltransferase